MATPTSKLQSSMKTLSLDSSSSKVRVALRVRPFLPSEIDASERNPIPCVAVLNPEHQIGEEVTVHLKDQYTSRNECYKLDSFFGQDEPVAQIFHHEVCAVIPEIFHGLNATVFAYGATGSGKTYTMQGTQDEPGLIPLAVSTVLSRCGSTQCRVEISYYEVYMDRCYDLLEPKAMEIMTLDDKDGRLQLKGLSSILVDSMDEFFDVFRTGIQRRKVAHTNLNDVSSRSHGVLVIHITNGSVRGKLNFIDLAGNEDNRRTCNEGIRLQESAKINQSLFALSNVIYALNNNEPRIPYRESKLTRILQDSLGGPSRALMVACLNPATYQEAVHTVSLAARSRQIVNYSGSSNKKDAPKAKIDMEAKLKAWLESKGKTKSAQRMNGHLSPSKGRTPASLNYLKNLGTVHSSVKVKIADSIVTNLKGRKLFDSDTPVSVKMEERILLSASIVEDAYVEIGDFPHQTSLDSKEEKSPSETNFINSGGLPGATSIKENVHPPSNTVGSSPTTQRIQELHKSPKKVLSTITSNMTPIQHKPSDDGICQFEPKTPKTPHVINFGDGSVGKAGTPLDIFNESGFHLKESLAQQYLSFLNVASREELMQLKGIGEKRAEYIIELRENSPKPLKSLSDLEKIGLSSRQVHGMFRTMASGLFS